MDEFSSEQEQVDALRKWWAENGKVIFFGIGLGILGLFGWNRYQNNLEQTAAQASTVYSRLLDAVSRGDTDVAVASQNELDRDFSSTPYAAQGLLAMARLHLDNGQPDSARDALAILVEANAPAELILVAKLRLARVLLYLTQPDEALAAIANVDAGNFQARFDEVRGDIAVVKSDPDTARMAYQSAIDNAGTQPLINVDLVEMKLAALQPGAAADSEANATEEVVP